MSCLAHRLPAELADLLREGDLQTQHLERKVQREPTQGKEEQRTSQPMRANEYTSEAAQKDTGASSSALEGAGSNKNKDEHAKATKCHPCRVACHAPCSQGQRKSAGWPAGLDLPLPGRDRLSLPRPARANTAHGNKKRKNSAHADNK